VRENDESSRQNTSLKNIKVKFILRTTIIFLMNEADVSDGVEVVGWKEYDIWEAKAESAGLLWQIAEIFSEIRFSRFLPVSPM